MDVAGVARGGTANLIGAAVYGLSGFVLLIVLNRGLGVADAGVHKHVGEKLPGLKELGAHWVECQQTQPTRQGVGQQKKHHVGDEQVANRRRELEHMEGTRSEEERTASRRRGASSGEQEYKGTSC